MNVTKADGNTEEFSKSKLLESIKRAGIQANLQDEVFSHVEIKLYDKIPTSEIYRHIIEFLGKSKSPFYRSRYSLKQAVMDLGPTGFPFEKFVARILEKQEFITTTNEIIKGKCIHHEIDVIAQKNNEKIMTEVKFHNSSGSKTEVHVALYTKARFEDVSENGFTSVLLITNTKVTLDAISYCRCSQIEIVSWSYPQNGGLRDLIEKYHLHPITSLQTLTNVQKQRLLSQNIVLCSEIDEKCQPLIDLGLSSQNFQEILMEAKLISYSRSTSGI